MIFPEPVIEVAVEPKSKADQEKLGVALAKLAAEDPSFRVSTDSRERTDHPEGDGRTALGHQSRHFAPHLQGRRQYRRAAGGVTARRITKRPRSTTPTRSRPAVPASSPRVKFIVEPNEPGKGFEFESKIVGGAVPKEYIPGVEKGLNSVHGLGSARRLPGGRRQGRSWSTARITTSTPRRWPSKSRRARRFREALQKGESGAARADHEGRGA